MNLYHLNDMHMFSDENLTVSFEEFLMGESYQKQIHDILTVLVFFPRQTVRFKTDTAYT